MRGKDTQQSTMFSYLSPAERVPANHSLRYIHPIVNTALRGLSTSFDEMYSVVGRPSIAPEKLLKALLLQVLFTIRSERLLMEQLSYNLLFRWFVGLNMDEPVWVPTVYSKNRDRLLESDIAGKFFSQGPGSGAGWRTALRRALQCGWNVDRAWASQKSFQSKEGSGRRPDDSDPGNPTVDFHGEKRSNDTHESTTDADARLARKRRRS